MAKQNVVFFVGAGLSVGCENDHAAPFLTWRKLIDEGLNFLSEKESAIVKRYIGNGDLISAAQFIKECNGAEWNGFLDKEFRKPSTPSELHKEIIMLKPRIILTTNYDKLIEKAWYDDIDQQDPTIINTIDNKTMAHIRKSLPCVIHVHGTYDDVDSMVLGTDGYHKHAFFNDYYKTLITTILLTHTMFFIGTSLSDPAISLLLEEVAHKYCGVRPHYIIWPRDIENEEVHYLKKYKYIVPIKCQKEEISDLLKCLREQVEKRRKEYLL